MGDCPIKHPLKALKIWTIPKVASLAIWRASGFAKKCVWTLGMAPQYPKGSFFFQVDSRWLLSAFGWRQFWVRGRREGHGRNRYLWLAIHGWSHHEDIQIRGYFEGNHHLWISCESYPHLPSCWDQKADVQHMAVWHMAVWHMGEVSSRWCLELLSFRILHHTDFALVAGNNFTAVSKTQCPGILILTIEMYIASLGHFAVAGANAHGSMGASVNTLKAYVTLCVSRQWNSRSHSIGVWRHLTPLEGWSIVQNLVAKGRIVDSPFKARPHRVQHRHFDAGAFSDPKLFQWPLLFKNRCADCKNEDSFRLFASGSQRGPHRLRGWRLNRELQSLETMTTGSKNFHLCPRFLGHGATTNWEGPRWASMAKRRV